MREKLILCVPTHIQIICDFCYEALGNEFPQNPRHELFQSGFRAWHPHGTTCIDTYALIWSGNAAKFQRGVRYGYLIIGLGEICFNEVFPSCNGAKD